MNLSRRLHEGSENQNGVGSDYVTVSGTIRQFEERKEKNDDLAEPFQKAKSRLENGNIRPQAFISSPVYGAGIKFIYLGIPISTARAVG
jgi:hypothetical protein